MGQAPRTAPKCARCKDGRLLDRHWPWKRGVSTLLKCTLVLWPIALFLTAKPDFYECDACGHKKGALWM